MPRKRRGAPRARLKDRGPGMDRLFWGFFAPVGSLGGAFAPPKGFCPAEGFCPAGGLLSPFAEGPHLRARETKTAPSYGGAVRLRRMRRRKIRRTAAERRDFIFTIGPGADSFAKGFPSYGGEACLSRVYRRRAQRGTAPAAPAVSRRMAAISRSFATSEA